METDRVEIIAGAHCRSAGFDPDAVLSPEIDYALMSVARVAAMRGVQRFRRAAEAPGFFEPASQSARSQEDLVKFAAAKGYDFDAQELAEVATGVRGREMSDADLEGVSGGGSELKPGEWAPGVAEWVAALIFLPFLPREPGH